MLIQFYMSKAKILIVDDEPDMLELLDVDFSNQGYEVITAKTGEDAIIKTRDSLPDLILLDLMLPGIDGFDVCRDLRSDPTTKKIPIIMLTAKNTETDVTVGLELGADDYVTKPFSNKILASRVKALLRRSKETPTENEMVITKRELTINPAKHEVYVSGNLVDLSLTEFRILNCLVKKPGWVFNRNQLVSCIHGGDCSVTERSVDVQIVALRKKLGSASKYIETVRGVGYKFKENI